MTAPTGDGPAVALVIHRRPDLTARVFDAIRAARPARLFVIADGARLGHPGEAEAVAEARDVTERVDWPCRVTRIYAESNLGCTHRVVSGLDAVFAEVPEAIVLEDDCLPHPTFFRFCAELLRRYRDEPRVLTIGGHLWQWPDGFVPESYWLSRYPAIWGWATWASAWALREETARAWRSLRETTWIEDRFGGAGTASAFWRRELDADLRGEGTWDYMLAAAHWRHDGVAIRPSANLVANLGFDASATHTRFADHPISQRPAVAMEFPLRHPASLEPDPARDAMVEWIDHSGRVTRQLRMGHARRREGPASAEGR